MWGLTKPRRGVFKPGGTPRLGVGAPRGLQICAPIADQALFATVNRTGPAKPTFIGTAGTVSPIRAGAGWAPNGSTTNTGCLSYKTVNVSGPISIEAWFVAGSSGINRAIAGFNDLADGTSGTADKALGLDFAGRAYAYVFDGGQKVAIDTSQTFTQGRLVHLALTYDGTTLSLYVDGALKSTIAAASSYTGYTTPHLCCGSFNTGFGSTGTVDSILLVNMAYAAWTAAEVAGRPFVPPPRTTALGALLSHITGDAEADSYQPMNINFGLFPPPTDEVKKKQRKEAYTARAKADLAAWLAST